MDKKFKTGDKVKVISKWESAYGLTGIVISYDQDGDANVEFEANHDWTHNCNGAIPSGRGDWFIETGLELVNPKELTEIIAGVNELYEVGEYRVDWHFGEDYKNDDWSQLKIYNKINLLAELRIGRDNLSIERANEILKLFGAVIVEPEPATIKIKAESGQELEISVDKARELGFEVNR